MDSPPVNIQLELAVREQSPILANLLELYAHDFSEFHPLDIGSDGRFGYKHLPLYWSESNRYPFLIRFDGNLAGLALVKRGSEISDSQDVWDNGGILYSPWLPQTQNRNPGRTGGVETFSRTLGGSSNAIQSFGDLLLEAGDF